MFLFFTDPYEEEILYSSIARYHYYSGNVNYKDTLEEVFGSRTCIPSIAFPSRLEFMSKQLGSNSQYTSKYLIDKYTLFPPYIPFLSLDKRQCLENMIMYSDGKGLYTKIGMVAGSICIKKVLYYCPECVKQDKKLYGEAFFHRVHQVQGVFVCPIHFCYLNKYLNPQKKVWSRLEFIRLNENNIDYNTVFEKDETISKWLIMIADSVQFLLKNDFRNYNQSLIYDMYKSLLYDHGYKTINGMVKQRELHDCFKSYYSERLLNMLESNVDSMNEWNWLKMITRKPKKTIHPIRNILFILFLCDNIKEFFYKKLELKEPFGNKPWPCLNPVVDHFKKSVVNNCNVTADYKTRKPVGTFSCSCGFVYSRTGPDSEDEDRFRIGRIKEFGYVWENKLRELVLEKKYKVGELARIMNCDPKTIKKYADKMMLSDKLNISIKIETNGKPMFERRFDKIHEEYENDILKFIEENPSFSRTEIRNKLQKQYSWFYRNDKEWLDKNLPSRRNNKNGETKNNSKINWQKRDEEIKSMIENKYFDLLSLKKPVRITKSLIGQKIGKAAMLNYYIDKLPETEEYLNSIIETVEEFQVRRIDKICSDNYNKKGSIKKWEIVRIAGLRPNYSELVNSRINYNINLYMMKDNMISTEMNNPNIYH